MVKLVAHCIEVCAQTPNGFGAGIGVRNAVANERFDARFDQRIELLVDVGVDGSLASERETKQSPNPGSQIEAHQRPPLMSPSCERRAPW